MSCGTVLADKWEKFKADVKKGKNPKKAMDALGVNRYCCRSLFLTHVDLMEKVGRYKVVAKKK